MKKLLFPIFLLCFVCNVHGQNLVFNGDFETVITCPTAYSQTNRCLGWRSFTSGSSDFFHTCGTGTATVPNTGFGYQQPASGNAFLGGYSFSNATSTTNYKELVAGELISKMQIGQPYEISVSVNLSNNSGWACNDLGIFLYDDGPTTYSGSGIPPVTPQIMFSSFGIITDTLNWVRLSALYYPDSTYDNIVVGGWIPTNVVNKVAVHTGSFSYYYFDSLVVKPVNGLLINYSDSLLCAGNIINVSYTINTPGYFQTGNVFTLQLSDAAGSFANPTVLGSQAGTGSGSISATIPSTLTPGTGYRLRVKSSNPVDSSNISLKPISIGIVQPAKPVITSNSPVCNGQVLNLNANTPTMGVSYKWTGPDLFSSTSQNPSVINATAAASGNYVVTAWLFGCSAKDTEIVVVNAVLPPVIAAANTPVCEGQALNLTSTTTTSGSTYSWTGPNSFTSNTQNPTINNVSTAGNGDYYLVATYNGCVVKDTVTVQVNPLPADFSATSNSPICTTSPLNLFGNTSSGGVTYGWTGPNSFTSAMQNPTLGFVTIAAGGDYILTATLNGCSIKDTETVVVIQAPASAVIAYTTNNPVCQNAVLQLNASNTLAGTVYSWTGPNSFTSGTQNPTISSAPLAATGDYIVSATLNGCVIKDTVTATVLAAPANINATVNTPLCEGQFLGLNVTNSTTGVTYSWAGPNSFTSAIQSPSINNVTTAASGDYITTLSINGCTLKDTVTVVVHPIPGTPAAGSNTPVCNGNPINLTSGGSLPGVTYNWTGPNAFMSNQQNPTITNANTGMAGNYSVTATLNGCTSPVTTTVVTVLYFPSSVTAYPLPNDTICIGGTIQFIAVASNGGASPQYKWMKNGSIISGATAISYTTGAMITGDKFRAVLTPDNTCPDPDTSAEIEVAVLPYVTPSVAITASPGTLISPWQTITFTAVPVNGGKSPTYQWKRNGQNIVGAVNDTWGAYTLSNNDTISVELFSSEYCPAPASASSNKIIVAVKTGVDDVKNKDGLVLYPNPNNGDFTLKGNMGTSNDVSAEVWNGIGQLVYKATLQPRNGVLNTNINLDKNLASGVYILKLNTTDSTKLLRFTISK